MSKTSEPSKIQIKFHSFLSEYNYHGIFISRTSKQV